MLILHHANIRTLHSAYPNATALILQDERILAVGSDAEILAEAIPGAEIRDMHGKTIWPGLIDGHMHLETYALGLQKIDCETPTLEECLKRVGERAHQTPPGEWLLGHGWNHNHWAGGYGTAADLDRVAPNHPVYLTAKSLHASWANSLALQQAGITDQTPDPEGGSIQRDANGNATGILFEAAASLVENNAIPAPRVEKIAEAIHQAQSKLWAMGLTGLHDFDRSRCFAALQLLNERAELGLRVIKGIPREDLPHAVAMGLRSGFGNEFLRIGPVKLFADGALGPQTAAMFQPYEGKATDTGMLLMDEEEIFETGRLAAQSGLSLATHAIGDRAVHSVLNAYAHLRDYEAKNHLPHLRHRIEHVQLLHPSDTARLAQLGVVASMQPIHATSDMEMADRYWGDRAQLSYAWNTVLKHQTHLSFGSDAPVETPNPFWGIYAAVTRCRIDGAPGGDGWVPAQRISLEDALQAYTLGAAYSGGVENQQGKIAPGYLADLILLDQDPFDCAVENLYQIQPSATMVSGRWVWTQP